MKKILALIYSSSLFFVPAMVMALSVSVPGSVTVAPGQSVVWNHPGYANDGSQFFTLTQIDSSNAAASGAQLTVTTSMCQTVTSSGTSPLTPCNFQNVTLVPNVTQDIGQVLFTLTSLSPSSATISIASETYPTFTTPGSVTLVPGQKGSDSYDGYVLTLNSSSFTANTVTITFITQSPCHPTVGGDCAIAQLSSNNATLSLNQPQQVGSVYLTLTALSGSGATIQISTSAPNISTPPPSPSPSPIISLYSANPTSGYVPLPVNFSVGNQTFTNIDYGDGNKAAPLNTSCTAGTHGCSVWNVSHTYIYPGNYAALLMNGSQVIASIPIAANAKSPVTSPMPYHGSSCPSINRLLKRGSSGSDVTALQQFFISSGYIPASLLSTPTGYFGALTEIAVQQWQSAHGIVSGGTPATSGYGAVGPRTRASLFSCNG